MSKNIFACLVHENFECIVDLLQNLRYFDPDSAIILYNGGTDKNLLTPSFPYKEFNAVVHPSPRPMKWGALHGFALDCIDFALDTFTWDSMTIVDSDQLLVRGGYSAYIQGYLESRPDAGFLGISARRQGADSGIYPVMNALAELELWQPFLRQFENGRAMFPFWTLWPTSVLTQPAAAAISRLLHTDGLLEDILRTTAITAVEEILFPTLTALSGFQVLRNPCSHDFVKWNAEMGPQHVDAARARLNAFWMHPVRRQYNNPARAHLRERCGEYVRDSRGVPMGAATVPSAESTLLPQRAIIEAARHIEGWFSDAEGELLIAAVQKACSGTASHKRRIVEIGSYEGKSTVMAGLAIRHCGADAEVFAIDPFDGVVGSADSRIEETGNTYDTFLNNIRRAGIEDIVRPVKRKSFEVDWNQPIDMVFVDGLHDYPNVARDFHHFAPWLTEGGLLAFHDYAAYYPGVRCFVDELLCSGSYKLLQQAESLVVLEKGRQGTRSVSATEIHADTTALHSAAAAVNGRPKISVPDTSRPAKRNGVAAGVARPEVSIIIPVHNEGERLFLTLEALQASTTVRHNVIVVDDDSTDGGCDFLRQSPQLYPNVRLVSAGERKGVAGTRNFGAQFATAPVYLFLDAHCFPRQGWLSRILALFDNEYVGIAAPCLSVAGNTAVKGYGLTLKQRDFSVEWLGKRQDRPYEVPLVGGGCMAVRADVFNAVGGFDSMNTFGVEDIEMCLRIWLLGYTVMLEPAAEVAHWFKEHSNFRVDWNDYTYNLLRMAILHFDGERYQRIMNELKSKPAYASAMRAIEQSDAQRKRQNLRTLRKRDADWFCEKFALPI